MTSRRRAGDAELGEEQPSARAPIVREALILSLGLALGFFLSTIPGFSLSKRLAASGPLDCPVLAGHGLPPASLAPSSSDIYRFKGPLAWSCLPEAARREYTLEGKVSVIPAFFDYDSGSKSKEPPTWTDAEIDGMIKSAAAGEELAPGYCGATSYLKAALATHSVKGKRALVVGSIKPWVESVLLLSGAATPVTTVDFNAPVSKAARIRSLGVLEFARLAPQPTFDLIVSYSSLEHDGLGRYGDPLNPNGDLQEMRRLATLLAPGGLLMLGVPIGRDVLVFNAHRIYGPQRLPLLTKGWDMLGLYGSGKTLEQLAQFPQGDGMRGDCDPNPNTRNWEQPVMVLRRPT
mmetsp:Transcript_63049/g.149456  ORF Transcript_63049/g.149456 Transcript_63049/m.149456 type:complete len:348 (+) Transcript_63049:118-1161(+)